MLNKSFHFLIIVLVSFVMFIACSREDPLRDYKVQKIGISIKIPQGWDELKSVHMAHDNLFAIGTEEEGIFIEREPCFSISTKYPNLPRRGVSMSFVKANAVGAKLVKMDTITIAGSEYFYGIKEVEIPNKGKVWVMYATFWNERDTFYVSLIASPSTFKKKEALFKKVVESIKFIDLDKAFSKEQNRGQLLPLPKKYSELTSKERNGVRIETIKTEDLPPGFKKLRHTWKAEKLTEKGVMEEELWREYLLRGDEVFYIKHKVYIPSILSPGGHLNPLTTTGATIWLILEDATGRKILGDEDKFGLWLLNALTAYYNGLPVNTKFEGDGFYISLKRKDDDLILEIARSETINALYKCK
jgi:hypothetical protein